MVVESKILTSRNTKDTKIYQKTKQYLEKTKTEDIDEKLKIIDKVLDCPEGEERYRYLYDLICDYLDNEFHSKNICGFKNNLCRCRCNLKEKHVKKNTYENGCCHSYKEGKDCEYLDASTGCKIKNIACKTYTCHFLRKQGYRYTLDNIYLSRYFFNRRQKFYIENTYFVDKPEIIEGILKRR